MSWWLFGKKKPVVVDETLRPGMCECEHERCNHEDGKGRCHAGFPVDAEWPNGAQCACQVYIRVRDSDAGTGPSVPTPSELEKLYKL